MYKCAYCSIDKYIIDYDSEEREGESAERSQLCISICIFKRKLVSSSVSPSSPLLLLPKKGGGGSQCKTRGVRRIHFVSSPTV